MQQHWPLLTTLASAETINVYQDSCCFVFFFFWGVCVGGGGVPVSLSVCEAGAEETWINFTSVAETLPLSVIHTPPTRNSARLELRRVILSVISSRSRLVPLQVEWNTYQSGLLVLKDMLKQHGRLSAALAAAACYERLGGWSLEIWSVLRSGKWGRVVKNKKERISQWSTAAVS